MNDRTRTILLAAIFFFVFINWSSWMKMLGYAPEHPPITQTTQSTTTQSAGSEISSGSQATNIVVKPIIPTEPINGAGPLSAADLKSYSVSIGSAEEGNPAYAMQLSINPIGGGLKQVLLNEFKDRVGSNDRFVFQKPSLDDKHAAFLTKSIKIGDQVQDISDAVWKLSSEGTTAGEKATLTLDLADSDGKPLVRLVKTYEIQPKGTDHNGPLGYEVKFSQSIKNISDTGAIDASTTIVGPTFPDSDLARGGDRMVLAGHQGTRAVAIHSEMLEAYTKDYRHKDYTGNRDGQKLLWFGAGSNYFFSVVHPQSDWIKSATGDLLNPDEHDFLKHKVQLLIESKNTGSIGAGKSVDYTANIYFGPRSRTVLQNTYYSTLGREYYVILESGSICSSCGLQGLINWLSNLLMTVLGLFQHYIFHDWGISIIALVFIVRSLLHPITKKSQVNMSQMSKMGPEIERIKKKYANDQEAMNRAMMDFYKNHGATPILGCLPMFLQMPIWIALYSGLSSTFDLRLAPFLYGFTWIKDLSKPDSLITLAPEHHLNFLFLHIDGLHVLPLLMSVMFYIQFKLQPKPPTMTPEQEQQQTMMKWMTTILFPLMLYTSPSGLTLYIFTSTLFGIIESKIIRKHIKENEDKKASGITFVDGEVIDKTKQLAAPKEPQKLGWFARMQQWAEAQRQNVEKETKKRKK